mmetsp:Transcript_15384/g.42579  ORF Transcript_15384/g.42579 Transcript_15384/m.42579 type:complete len:381 (-) Transcript_15384:655-1797(-)
MKPTALQVTIIQTVLLLLCQPSLLTALTTTTTTTKSLSPTTTHNARLANSSHHHHLPFNPNRMEEESSSRTARTESTLAASGGPWVERAKELLEFAKLHGHCIVPKRYAPNKSLANWVNKQRQEYRRFHSGEKPCSLTQDRIDILNELGFCWDASSICSSQRKNQQQQGQQLQSAARTASTLPPIDFSEQVEKEEEWWDTFELLQSYMTEHQISYVHDVPHKSRLDDWVKSVRSKWQSDQQQGAEERKAARSGSSRVNHGTPSNTNKRLSSKQIKAMTSVDRYWHLTARQATWEKRFLELLQYRQQHGDCCVPISYQANKKLANWVSTQRKQYNLRRRGQKSGLTDERLERLRAIGFVWNRWEHEFSVKQQQQQQQRHYP